MKPIIEARDVRYSYPDGPEALKGISIAIEEGEKIALVGPNGAGKSTLMLMCNGILRPRSGEVLFRGVPLAYDSRSLRDIRRKVGMVFQNPDDQIFAPTVRQDVSFGPSNLGFPKDKVERYVRYALAYVGLEGYESRPPHHLSGGEKKRVAIAGVLAMEPDVMILDEPTAGLDPATAEEIMDMLDELNCGGKTMIVSTHDVELAYRWADEVVLISEGDVIYRGTPRDAFSQDEIVSRARMKPPVVVEVFRELKSRGVVAGDRTPGSILDLTDIIGSAMKVPERSGMPGEILICDVERTEPAEVASLAEDADYIGAMGTIAKQTAEKAGIHLDFTYGVIDKCILKALIGRSSLIMTSGGMVDHALKRIGDYGREDHMDIKAGLAGRGPGEDRGDQER